MHRLTAFTANRIYRVIARIEKWWGADEAVMPRSNNGLESDLKACLHGVLKRA
jgi:hypothetical protein